MESIFEGYWFIAISWILGGIILIKFDDWVKDVKYKAQQFQVLTDVKANLIGMQNVW